MDNNKALEVKEIKIMFNPERDTAKAKKAADQLIDIVKQNGWAVKLGGKSEHLMYEGWQTVGKYYNVTVGTGDAEPVEIAGIFGFKAKAWAIDNRTGIRVGEAEAYCMEDEPNWNRKPHVNQYGKQIAGKPFFQLASMAQTRAGSKALRQIFGFVVALAGYNPTPAEEMIKDNDPDWIKKPTPLSLATESQIKFIEKLLEQKGKDKQIIYDHRKIDSLSKLTKLQASKLIEQLIIFPDLQKETPQAEDVMVVDPDEADKGIAEMQK